MRLTLNIIKFRINSHFDRRFNVRRMSKHIRFVRNRFTTINILLFRSTRRITFTITSSTAVTDEVIGGNNRRNNSITTLLVRNGRLIRHINIRRQRVQDYSRRQTIGATLLLRLHRNTLRNSPNTKGIILVSSNSALVMKTNHFNSSFHLMIRSRNRHFEIRHQRKIRRAIRGHLSNRDIRRFQLIKARTNTLAHHGGGHNAWYRIWSPVPPTLAGPSAGPIVQHSVLGQTLPGHGAAASQGSL